MTPYGSAEISKVDRLLRGQGVGAVYIIAHAPEGPVKIGKTTGLALRLASLQVGNPSKLHVFALKIVRHGEVRATEARIHAELRTARLSGEWFSLSVLEAVAALRGSFELCVREPQNGRGEAGRGQEGTKAENSRRETSHTALKAIYKKRRAEWSRNVPDPSR